MLTVAARACGLLQRLYAGVPLIVAFAILVLSVPAQSQQQNVLELIKDNPIPVPGDMEPGDEQSVLPAVWCADVSDEETRAICWKAYRAGLNYFETGLEHRTSVFRWQHLSTRIIFFVVIALVVLGIYFAWVQFRRDTGAGAEQDHELELSTSGIKVRSPVLGVIILALSLGFFYLYLAFVYPITEIF